MAKESKNEARQPASNDAAVASRAHAAVTIPAVEMHVGFVKSLGRLAQAASQVGQHQQHAILHDLEVRAGSLLTHALAAQSQLDGDAADVVRELCRSL